MTTRRSILSLLFACAAVVCSSNTFAASPAKAASPKELVLASGSALVVDLNSDKVVYSSNPDMVRPIASVTKLMTAMVVLDAKLPLDEQIDVDISETAEMKGVFSRVHLGSRIDRRQMLLLALMSSENRAAASLAHHYPGGSVAFVKAMNAKAKSLGMLHTHYVEPTGLSIDKATGKVSFPAMAKLSAYINYDHYAATTYVNTDINNEDLDTANAFASNVFTAPSTGLYKVGYSLGWTQNGANAPTSMHGRLLKNGATEVLPAASRASNNAADTGKIIICTQGIISLTAGDTLRLQHKFSSLDGYASANITRL